MTIGLILNPYKEARPSGLGRAVAALAGALKDASPQNTFIEFTKEKLGGGRFWLEKLRGQQRADCYIFFTPVMPLFWKPQKSIVIVHDLGYFPLSGLRSCLIAWRHGQALRRATRIVAVSQATKAEIIKHFRISPEKITVIYNGTNEIARLAPEPIVDLPDTFFLFVGVIKERKNVLTLAKAFTEYRARGGTAGLVIAGKMEGEYARKVQEELASLGHAVQYLGYVSDAQLAYLFSKALAFVYPSLVEGFGMTVVEAMQAGLPVITSNFGALKEVVGDAAHTTDPRSPAAIAEALKRLAGDQELRTELSARGRARAAQFSWPKAGAELLEQIHAITRA